MTIEEKLYSMKIHDVIYLNNYEILRVPHGWLYTYKEKVFGNGLGEHWVASSTFVPK